MPDRPSHPIARFARKLWGLSAWMIELIAVLSFVLGKRADLVVALSLLLVNAVLGFLQEQRASSAVAALRHRLQIVARVLRDGRWQAVPARELVVGDVIRLRSGDFVPADAQALDGTAQADQSTLTGEAQALDKTAGDVLYAGSIVRQGETPPRTSSCGTAHGRRTKRIRIRSISRFWRPRGTGRWRDRTGCSRSCRFRLPPGGLRRSWRAAVKRFV
ncbi:MAG: hypothetical protein ACM3SQ_05985 [Betaproteobacteria bacterium]